jgi:methyl-accepting chemotaxis protein
MTTKIKIIIGFIAMIILLGGVSVFGYLKIEEASESFTNYRRTASINTLCSDMSTAMEGVLRYTEEFLRTFDAKSADSAITDVENLVKLSANARGLTKLESRTKMFDSMQQRGEQFKTMIKGMRDEVLDLRKEYSEKVRPAYYDMYKAFNELNTIAHEVKNVEVLFAVGGAWSEMATLVTSLIRFTHTLSPADAKQAGERLESLQDEIVALGGLMVSEKGKQLHKTLTAGYGVLRKSLTDMEGSSVKTRATVEQLSRNAHEVSRVMEEFSTRLDDESRQEAENVLNTNETTKRTMAVASVAGLVFGVVLALVIILGLVGTLSKMAAFSKAVAEGDFNSALNIREKGEIGLMAASLKAIPDMLNRMLAEYKRLENEIGHGVLTALGNRGEFKGEFAALIHGTNNILTRFRTVVDSLPSPVIMMDGDTKLRYMNIAGQEVAGSDFQGKVCKQLFNREDDGTPGDALQRAVQTKERATAETRAHPKGATLDISYTAIPLLGENRELAAVIQLITDLTAIRTQQRAVHEVTGQAAEISNRMAAASEELSAQVEQVSRGAEMQRERVESTASAMNEMNSTVLEVARNAGQASEQSENTRSKANDGAALVNKVVQSINSINQVATVLQNNMQELGAKAESIGGVMNVISDIADQTNLLALNAAIEAARAGEAGRGFAVVADEVRKLAEKTMSATQEVGGSITAIQQSAQTNIGEVGSAVKSISEATKLANSSGEALKEIVDLAAANSAIVASIATAAEEQSSTSEEINRAIDEINHVVSDTAQGMVQSSAAVQELSNMAQELRMIMEKIK